MRCSLAGPVAPQLGGQAFSDDLRVLSALEAAGCTMVCTETGDETILDLYRDLGLQQRKVRSREQLPPAPVITR